MSPSTWFRLLGLSALLVALGFLPALTQETKGKSYALLIGVNKYHSAKLPALRYAENDVTELDDALRKQGGFSLVRVLSNSKGEKNADDRPTAVNIRNEIKALVAKKGANDTLLIALAGHGLQLEVEDPEPDKNKKGRARIYSYFCPHDADLTDEVSYSTGKCASLVQLSEVFDALNKSGAGTRLVLVDACRDEMRAENVVRSAADLDIDQLKVPKGIGAMFSCSAGERARETPDLGKGHGVFFHHIIAGLRGEAKNRKGLVTWDSLADYVKDEVPAYVKDKIGLGARQKPAALGHLEGAAVLARFDISSEKDKGKAGKSETPGNADVVKGPLNAKGENSIGMAFKRIVEGKTVEFMMGASKDDDAEADDNEKPRHKVKLTKDFYMQVTEVTQGQFEKIMGYNPSYFSLDGKGDGTKYEYAQPAGGKEKVKEFTKAQLADFPVENVSYTEAVKFCEKLNEQEKKTLGDWKYSLPTEAQWEYCCRGGASSYKKFHVGDTLSDKDANFNNQIGRTAKAGSYPANAFGLRDMHGNVWEWCADWYDKYPDGEVSDPAGPLKGSYRVIRGGYWNNTAGGCRSAPRSRADPGYRRYFLGFRVALVPAR